MKFDCNYPHASTVKQIDQWPAIPTLDIWQGFFPPLFAQTTIALHCIISSLRLGLVVRSSRDRVIPLVYLLYRGSMGIIAVELHLTPTR